MFKCDKCGCCCKHLDKIIYADLNRGDGICKYLVDNLCSIYDNRPLLCRVDASYEIYFKDSISIEDYYRQNYAACKKLKEMSKNE